MKKSGIKWGTRICPQCSYHEDNYTGEHYGYSGKIDANAIEYVICGETQKRINVFIPCNSIVIPPPWFILESQFNGSRHPDWERE